MTSILFNDWGCHTEYLNSQYLMNISYIRHINITIYRITDEYHWMDGIQWISILHDSLKSRACQILK